MMWFVQPLIGPWKENNVGYVWIVCEGEGDARRWIGAEGVEKAPAFEYCVGGRVAGYGC